jgi:AcrR family transcriptional regulator
MAIYRHFSTRDALLKRLSDDSFNMVAEDWKARRARSPDVFKRLMALVEPYLDYALAHPHLFDHAFSVRRDDARRYPEDFRAGLSPTFNVALAAVIEGMAEGALKQDDPHDVTMAIWAQQHGLIALYRAGRFSYDEAQFRAFYIQSMGRLIDGIKA